MARPTTHDAALRDRLLEMTAELVDRDGPQRVSLREVAALAGTSTSAIYSLFGGKDALLASVIESGFASFAASQEEAEPAGLRALGVAYRDWALAHAPLYRLMFGGVLDRGCEPGAAGGAPPDATARAIQPLARTLARLRPELDPSGMRQAMVVWAHVHGMVSLQLARVPADLPHWDALYEDLLDATARVWGTSE